MDKVIFHIDENSKWPTVMSNLANYLEERSDSDIKVVANGDAVIGYRDNKEVRNFIKNHPQITFDSCHNAMQSHDVSEEELPEDVIQVPAGIPAIVGYQNEDYRYIKP